MIQGKSVFSKTGDEVVILGVEAGRYYSLNPVGARFWELLQQPVAIRDAVAVITSEFDAPPAAVEQDLIELVGQLVEAGLVRTADENPR